MSDAKTLREVGVPGSLASEMETWLRQLGHTKGEEIVDYKFVSRNGSIHPLRLESTPKSPAAKAA